MKSYGDTKYKMVVRKDKASGEKLAVLFRVNEGYSPTKVGEVVKHRTGYAVMANNMHSGLTGQRDMKFSFPTAKEAKDAMWLNRDDFKANRHGLSQAPKEVCFAAE